MKCVVKLGVGCYYFYIIYNGAEETQVSGGCILIYIFIVKGECAACCVRKVKLRVRCMKVRCEAGVFCEVRCKVEKYAVRVDCAMKKVSVWYERGVYL